MLSSTALQMHTLSLSVRPARPAEPVKPAGPARLAELIDVEASHTAPRKRASQVHTGRCKPQAPEDVSYVIARRAASRQARPLLHLPLHACSCLIKAVWWN